MDKAANQLINSLAEFLQSISQSNQQIQINENQ